jgi:hypothetical protein
MPTFSQSLIKYIGFMGPIMLVTGCATAPKGLTYSRMISELGQPQKTTASPDGGGSYYYEIRDGASYSETTFNFDAKGSCRSAPHNEQIYGNIADVPNNGTKQPNGDTRADKPMVIGSPTRTPGEQKLYDLALECLG